MEAVRIRAIGYPHRKSHEQFFSAYKAILPEKDRRIYNDLNSFSGEAACVAILENLSSVLDLNDIKVGKTKVFYRSSQLSALEKARNQAIVAIITHIQANVRRFIAKKHYRVLKAYNQRCLEALEQRNLTELRKLLKTFQEKSIELFIIKDAKILVQYLEAQQRIAEQLQAAIRSRNIDKLEGALSQAAKLKLKVMF